MSRIRSQSVADDAMPKGDALVSIVIPCYRQAHYLPAAVSSALGQSYAPIEVIVVNDGSDDGIESAIAPFLSRVKYLQQRNGGLPAARNAGLNVAKGKYALFLDSDDLLHPDSVRQLMHSAGGSEDSICVMGFRVFSAAGDPEPGELRILPSATEIKRNWLVENFTPPHTCMVPIAKVRAVGCFDRSLRSHEDWDLWTRLLLAGCDVRVVDFPGAYYRSYPGSMSKNELRMNETRARVLRRIAASIVAHPTSVEHLQLDWRSLLTELKRRAAKEAIDTAYILQTEGSYLQALRWYIRSCWWGGLNWTAIGGILKLLPHTIWDAKGREIRSSGENSAICATECHSSKAPSSMRN